VNTVSTKTIHETSTVAERPAWSTFKAHAAANNKYLVVSPPQASGYGAFYTPNLADGHLFAINRQDCSLFAINNLEPARAHPSVRSFVHFDQNLPQFPVLTCSVDANTLELSCIRPGRNEEPRVYLLVDFWVVDTVGSDTYNYPKADITVIPVS
jgi:hypothetical protein